MFQKADNIPDSSQLTEKSKWQLTEQKGVSQTEQQTNPQGTGVNTKCILFAVALFILKPEFCTIRLYEGSLYTLQQAPGAWSQPRITEMI